MSQKKVNYFYTIAQKNYAKFCRTGKESYLDKVIIFQEKAEKAKQSSNF